MHEVGICVESGAVVYDKLVIALEVQWQHALAALVAVLFFRMEEIRIDVGDVYVLVLCLEYSLAAPWGLRASFSFVCYVALCRCHRSIILISKFALA